MSELLDPAKTAVAVLKADQALAEYRKMERTRVLRWAATFLLPGFAMVVNRDPQTMAYMAMIGGFGVCGNIAADAHGRMDLNDAVRALQSHSSPLTVPTMLRVIKYGTRTAKGIALRSLLETIPLLTADHAGLFDKSTLHEFNSLIFHHNQKLAPVVLRGLRFVGDSTSVEALHAYISAEERQTKGAAPKHTSELTIARDSLKSLTDQLENARLKGLLVRAVESPDEQFLVRPAGNAPTEEGLLVRPSEAPIGEVGVHPTSAVASEEEVPVHPQPYATSEEEEQAYETNPDLRETVEVQSAGTS